MPRRKRSAVPPTYCKESEAKDITSGDACCESKCSPSTCDQKSAEAECTSLFEDASCFEPTTPDDGPCHRYYCNAVCGKKQVLALAGPTAQTVSCSTIRYKPKKKAAYSSLRVLPSQLSACSPTCGSPQQTSPCAHGCRIPLHFSPCTHRHRLPLHFASCNTPSVGAPDPCTTLCSTPCSGQCNTASGPGNEELVMTAYLPITIRLCQPACSSNTPCTCASPCKSPKCSKHCKK